MKANLCPSLHVSRHSCTSSNTTSNSTQTFKFSAPQIYYLASSSTYAPFETYCSGGTCISAGCERWTSVSAWAVVPLARSAPLCQATDLPLSYQTGCGLTTSGEYTIAVVGDSFGTSTSSYIQFGSTPTIITPSSISHKKLTFTVPSGSGKNKTVRVVVGSRTSNRVGFNYDPPYVSYVSPDTVDAVSDTVK